MLILAEALDDPEAVATALGALGTGYISVGAHRGGVILLESGAEIAREHDPPTRWPGPCTTWPRS